jgi:hypothetical protein
MATHIQFFSGTEIKVDYTGRPVGLVELFLLHFASIFCATIFTVNIDPWIFNFITLLKIFFTVRVQENRPSHCRGNLLIVHIGRSTYLQQGRKHLVNFS